MRPTLTKANQLVVQEEDEDDCDIEEENTNSASEVSSIDQSAMFNKHAPGLFGHEFERNLSQLNLE